MKSNHKYMYHKFSWYKKWSDLPSVAVLNWAIFVFVAVSCSSLIVSASKDISRGELVSVASQASESAMDLFASTTTASLSQFSLGVIKKQENSKEVRRFKVVEANLDTINPRKGNASSISIPLFDGRTIAIDKKSIDSRGQDNFTWYGKIRGSEKGEAVFTVVKGYLTAHIMLVDSTMEVKGNFDIVSADSNLYVLRELDFSQIADEPGVPVPDVQADTASLAANTTTTVAGDTGSTIDVLMLYSNQTALAAGAAIDSQLQAAVDAANSVYANSGINTRLRLVGISPLNYNEYGTDVFNTALSDIASARNGAENVPALRDAYRADLVSMFIENGAYCGMGYLGLSPSAVHTVVNRGCATGYYSFAHEVGHNFGAHHDPLTEPGSFPYAYGHGYVDPGCRFRTVMAYQSCGAPRVGYHSNPNIIYPGTTQPMGTTDLSNAARVINQNAYTVSNYKTETTTACVQTNPTISISPVTASGGAGQSLTYQVTVANKNDLACIGSTYTVNPTLPAGFAQTPSSLSFTLQPATQASQTIVVTSPVSAIASSYVVTQTALDAVTSLGASANATYSVVVPDVTAPVVNITNPVNGAKLTGGGGSKIDVVANATDASGIAQLSIIINGAVVKTCNQVATCTYRWSYSKVKAGTHTIVANSTDKSSNANKSSTSITVTK